MLPWFRDDGENLERWPSCASDTGAPGPKQLKEMLAKYSTEIPTTIVACFLKLDVAGMREVIASMSTAHLVSTLPTNCPKVSLVICRAGDQALGWRLTAGDETEVLWAILKATYILEHPAIGNRG
jgi:hypothetical protein